MQDFINVIYPFSISFLDYPDPSEHTIVVYMMGCHNDCSGCHNPQFKDPSYEIGTRKINFYDFLFELSMASQRYRTTNVVFSGGDPLSKYNINFTKRFLNINRIFSVCIYTGHTLEYTIWNEVSNYDFLVCNPFDPSQKSKTEKTDRYFQLASENQKIYDRKNNLLSINGKYVF